MHFRLVSRRYEITNKDEQIQQKKRNHLEKQTRASVKVGYFCNKKRQLRMGVDSINNFTFVSYSQRLD